MGHRTNVRKDCFFPSPEKESDVLCGRSIYWMKVTVGTVRPVSQEEDIITGGPSDSLFLLDQDSMSGSFVPLCRMCVCV